MASNPKSGMRAAFNFFDKDGSGAISMDELGDALRVKGFNPTWKELITLGKELDVNKNGQIDFEEFVVLCDKLGSIPERWKKESSKCIQAFAKLDKNGDGFITCAEFRACFPPRAGKVAPVEQMIASMDVNQDGKIDYNEYLAMIGKTKAEVEELLALTIISEPGAIR